ncbi:putative glyoxylase family protein [Octadecabacter arcticus 238]|jgi:catechol 2,3-dioxygenase-like lactoylglutathione lyase family enzyme|uniref:Putative glyoxylase family protein n=1 Tax=Octadecabacter arcticus 238 TaxID=391616 RepID=M9RQ15_9RHOB|nr:VOC family protein [Octadecabacter arcticus]AGI72486.1 putative glyoxylase family protein [Octadecabacter arcticus 238]
MTVIVNHTGITVKNLDRAESMFRDLFGFSTISRAPRDPAIIEAVIGVPGAEVEIVYMQNGPARIELLAYSAPNDRKDYRPRPVDLGSLHMAVNVTDMDEIAEKALAWPMDRVGHEVRIDAGPNEGARIAYFRTPEEGLIIELIQLPEGGAS